MVGYHLGTSTLKNTAEKESPQKIEAKEQRRVQHLTK
jgi:hypothetical protein